MRRIALLLCLLVLALGAGAALAEDSQFIEHEPLTLDGVWAEGATRPGEYHYYPFTVEEVGLATVRVQLFCGGRAQIMDGDLIQWDEHYFNGSAGAPETHDFIYYLEPGTYYLCVGNGSSQGDYRLKATLEPCLSDETPNNDDYLGAQVLPSGETLNGVLTQWDEHDYYTFTLDAETQVYLTANTTLESLMPNLMLYDGDMVKVSEKYGFKGYAEEMTLSAGTYYIDICGNKGPYTIKAVYGAEALPATVPTEEASSEGDADYQNERDFFDVAPEEDFTDPNSSSDDFGSMLFDLLDSF